MWRNRMNTWVLSTKNLANIMDLKWITITTSCWHYLRCLQYEYAIFPLNHILLFCSRLEYLQFPEEERLHWTGLLRWQPTGRGLARPGLQGPRRSWWWWCGARRSPWGRRRVPWRPLLFQQSWEQYPGDLSKLQLSWNLKINSSNMWPWDFSIQNKSYFFSPVRANADVVRMVMDVVSWPMKGIGRVSSANPTRHIELQTFLAAVLLSPQRSRQL